MALGLVSALAFGVLLVQVVYSGCDVMSDCKDVEHPVCSDGTCVECLDTIHCSPDRYCSQQKCVKYESEILGSYCDYLGSDTLMCKAGTMAICGACDDEDNILWKGSCLQSKCEQCLSGDHESGIAGAHGSGFGCYPKSNRGPAGVVKRKMATTFSSHSLRYTPISVYILLTNIIMFAAVVVNVFTCRKVKKN